ncbi:hypothetical protein EJ05DRAFT_248874 [Pseudovirgaria hyperparasitica]|uniref:Uncharacterized protein n=1 Tax=Pseudovirgaria hyperparasitica TaxID=470096 RepID=A0A6A6WDT9_9PEZI|nr:uncharacterized protein EJ05DRAFT_248874 [Pseudovirgaria hyperparasitica]KAF2760992.1 hypothetical protein EJ05DRAFT_248874 [Pseudovirgaria hyperparasitica]
MFVRVFLCCLSYTSRTPAFRNVCLLLAFQLSKRFSSFRSSRLLPVRSDPSCVTWWKLRLLLYLMSTLSSPSEHAGISRPLLTRVPCPLVCP